MSNKIETNALGCNNANNLVQLEDEFPYQTKEDGRPLDKSEIIFETSWKSFPIIIKSICGMFPTAYVNVKRKDLFDIQYDHVQHLPFEVTYQESVLTESTKFNHQTGKYEADETREGYWIGWDYGHFGQYNALMPGMGGTKYSINMILEDAMKFIDQFLIPRMEKLDESARSDKKTSRKSRK